MRASLLLLLGLSLCACSRRERARADAPLLLRVPSAAPCGPTIDGFGATAPPRGGDSAWVQRLFYDDLGARILRVDLTPSFVSPYADFAYSSPWHHGAPALPGPENNRVRTYKDAADYTRLWAGRRAQIAVMGRDIEQNIRLFDYETEQVQSFGKLAAAGSAHPHFQLIGSQWSPAPWLKQSSGHRIEGQSAPLPENGSPWPFIWNGNFAGGVLDTTDRPLALFHDGERETSALTQFARGFAAYVLGFQRRFGVRFSAVSLQNELNFETFYNSCAYPRAHDYVVTLKALRKELSGHAELRDIQLMGPEDLLDADPYALFQYGSGARAISKNLQYVAAIAEDPEAERALSFFAAHAYAHDGVHGSGADAQMWRWWLDGWSTAPAAGLPARVRGIRSMGRKSWMTETSSEPPVWEPPDGEPLANSAFGLALKIHHALTVGEQSAWLYWRLLDKRPVGPETLTDAAQRSRSPKYVAAKHFFRFIEPGSCRLELDTSSRDPLLHASAYRTEQGRRTLVILNAAEQESTVLLELENAPRELEATSSHARALFRRRILRRRGALFTLTLRAREVLTLVEPLGSPAQLRK